MLRADDVAIERRIALQQQAVGLSEADVIFSASVNGVDGQCGCPCCCQSTTITLDVNASFLPPELEGIYTMSDYESFASSINAVMKLTHWPLLPCLCAHFIIPFSPICAMSYCGSKRIQDLNKLVKKENEKLVVQGIYWEARLTAQKQRAQAMLKGRSFAVLKYNPTARAKYEANNPGARKLMPHAVLGGSFGLGAVGLISGEGVPASGYGVPPSAQQMDTSGEVEGQVFRFCNKCGTKLAATAEFCSKCGKRQ